MDTVDLGYADYDLDWFRLYERVLEAKREMLEAFRQGVDREEMGNALLENSKFADLERITTESIYIGNTNTGIDPGFVDIQSTAVYSMSVEL